MSKYEWERGTIVIPAKEWVAFRKTVIKAWNASEEAKLETATRAYEAAKAAAKGKRGAKRSEAIEAALRDACSRYYRSYGYGGGRREVDYELLYEVKHLVGDSKLTKPKKKDLDILPISKSCQIRFDDTRIALSNERRSVTWDVDENNRACETAHEHKVSKALFAALGRIKWTRGSGGRIYGNDEYNRESYDGANYTVREYGPKVSRR